MMVDADGAPAPDGDELARIQQELADAREALARAEHQAAAADGAAAQAAAENERLRAEPAAAGDAAAAHDGDMALLRAEIETADGRLREAAARYRDLVVRTEPALPPELIAGDSPDAVDASVEAARAVAGRVRAHIEASAQAARVPAGSPPRGGADTSALTPEQKIRAGLAQRAG